MTFFPTAPDGKEGRWRVKPENLTDEQMTWERNKEDKWVPYEVIYYVKEKLKTIKTRSIFYDVVSTTHATNEIKNLFGDRQIFDYSKPYQLIQHLLRIGTDKDDLVLDFFAGSGTTMHAAMALNKEDGGNRKCILVQVPEATDPKSEAHKAGYKKISEITIERNKRAIQALEKGSATANYPPPPPYWNTRRTEALQGRI